jgi:hypothetical protein
VLTGLTWLTGLTRLAAPSYAGRTVTLPPTGTDRAPARWATTGARARRLDFAGGARARHRECGSDVAHDPDHVLAVEYRPASTRPRTAYAGGADLGL